MKRILNFINTLCTDFGITLAGMVLTIMLIFPFIHNHPIAYSIGLGIVASFEILKMIIFKKNRLGKFERGILNIMFVFTFGISIHPVYQPLFGISPLGWPILVFGILFCQAIQAWIVKSYFKIR